MTFNVNELDLTETVEVISLSIVGEVWDKIDAMQKFTVRGRVLEWITPALPALASVVLSKAAGQFADVDTSEKLLSLAKEVADNA